VGSLNAPSIAASAIAEPNPPAAREPAVAAAWPADRPVVVPRTIFDAREALAAVP
jgi:hypothetical protein